MFRSALRSLPRQAAKAAPVVPPSRLGPAAGTMAASCFGRRLATAAAAAPAGVFRASAAAGMTVLVDIPASAIHTTPSARSGDNPEADQVREAGEDNFDKIMAEVGKGGRLVLVDFYADWCMPCKMLGPIIKKVATEEGVPLVKVNTDDAADLAIKYDISGLPTVISFKNGKKVSQFTGGRDEAFIREFIHKNS